MWVISYKNMFCFRELDDYSSKEQCSMSQFSFANEVERTASFSIILDFLLHILKMKLEKKEDLKIEQVLIQTL